MGRIFDIQRFSLHDGTGIRTLVFFQGCFLRCPWCCNPESQAHVPLPERAGNKAGIEKGTDKWTVKEADKWADIKAGREVSVYDVMEIVERDRAYYRRSGGGLTLSGGEILLQADFARDILAAARESGIHTAVESTALANFSEIEKILPHLDLFLMDIKHTDAAKHKKFTGSRNELALENARKIAEYGGPCKLIIRVPVIPGFNATVGEIKDIALFASKLAGVEEIHLLPYHRYGEGKYAALGREYLMGDVQAPSDMEMDAFKSIIMNTTKLICNIGG